MPAKTKPPLPPIGKAGHYIDRTREIKWINDHGDDYPGEWVALDGDRLLAHGVDAKQVFAEADRSGVQRPLFAHLESAEAQPEIGANLA